MKDQRQEKILELIRTIPIDRQETLLKHLLAAGIPATQATISRDIRQLHLVKIADGHGGYRYAAQAEQPVHNAAARFATIFRESVLQVDSAANIVLIKCYSGMANAACELFDAMHWQDVVGTLAGDDTFLVLMRSETAAQQIVQRLQAYRGRA